MDKSRLDAETMVYIRRIAELKDITEDEAMAAVINNYASRYALQVESAITAVERIRENYSK